MMELERFQLIPSQHFEVSLLSYFIILLYYLTLRALNSLHISPIQTEASVLKYTLSPI